MRSKLYSVTVLFLVVCMVIGSVFATWAFADLSPDPQNTNNLIDISAFMYAPEEILPDEEESAELQKNHMDLLYNILHHRKYGLNKSDTLDNAVERFQILFSQENISGGNLKHLFTTKESQLLDFAIEYITDTEFVLYTFETEDVESGTPESTWVTVYKVVLAYTNGKWDAAGAVEGSALVTEFETSNNKRYHTIDAGSFTTD